MIVELEVRRRRRPRRSVIIHRWIVHEHPAPVNWSPARETIFEGNQFVKMIWPRGPEAWDNVICRICNREFLWDKELQERCPPCPHCDRELDDLAGGEY